MRVDSDGDGGDVSQSNNVGSRATGLNVNLTGQSAEQIQAGSCGCYGGIGIQAIGQQASSEQGAAALSFALQAGASNDNAPVSVDSDGNGGSVDQSNNVWSSGDRCEPERARSERDSGSGRRRRDRDSGDRPVGIEHAGGARAVRGAAVRRLEQQLAGGRGQRRRRG